MATDKGGTTMESVVEATSADPRFIIIQCSECSAEVDRVEYDAAVSTPHVVTGLMSSLGVDEGEARSLAKRHNPDALKTPQENAEGLAKLIVGKKVPDRDAETYLCRNGHSGALEVRA